MHLGHLKAWLFHAVSRREREGCNVGEERSKEPDGHSPGLPFASSFLGGWGVYHLTNN